jgi:carbonic anhydrase
MPDLAAAMVITCIDFRFQQFIDQWLRDNLGSNKFDRVSLAGGVFDFYSILKQVEISHKLHQIKKVILINHEDCGAYGKESTFKRHQSDLIEAERKLEAMFPGIDVETYYLTLKGEFRKISCTRPRLTRWA